MIQHLIRSTKSFKIICAIITFIFTEVVGNNFAHSLPKKGRLQKTSVGYR